MKIWILPIIFLLLSACVQNTKDEKENSANLKTKDFTTNKLNPNFLNNWHISYFELQQNELNFSSEKQEFGKFVVYYKFTFNKNGKIEFDDLTKGYDCGMGIMKINSGDWKIQQDKYLTMELVGEFTGDFEFNTKFVYEIVKLNEKQMDLKLVNIDNYCQRHYSRVVL